MRPRTINIIASIAAGAALFVQLPSSGAATTVKVSIRRIDRLLVTCGVQVQAHGVGASPNEIVKVRVQEQVPNGIDLTSELVADSKGRFVMNDFCDPKDPNAEIPALWSFRGVTSGRTGKTLVRYQLAKRTTTTSTRK